jgi:hypothetical protein
MTVGRRLSLPRSLRHSNPPTGVRGRDAAADFQQAPLEPRVELQAEFERRAGSRHADKCTSGATAVARAQNWSFCLNIQDASRLPLMKR